MPRTLPALSAALALAIAAVPAVADGGQQVLTRDGFVTVVEGRKLTRFGIALTVLPAGGIEGRAFGRQVSGKWRWEGGHFCRELRVGDEAVALNCQVVEQRGATVRFIADKGQGDHADFRIR